MPSSTRSLRPAQGSCPLFLLSATSRDIRFVCSTTTQAPRGAQGKACIAVQTIADLSPRSRAAHLFEPRPLVSLSKLSLPSLHDLGLLVCSFHARSLRLRAELKILSTKPQCIPPSPISPILHLLLLLSSNSLRLYLGTLYIPPQNPGSWEHRAAACHAA